LKEGFLEFVQRFLLIEIELVIAKEMICGFYSFDFSDDGMGELTMVYFKVVVVFWEVFGEGELGCC